MATDSEANRAPGLQQLREPPRWAKRFVGWVERVWPESRRARVAAAIVLALALLALIAIAFALPLVVDATNPGQRLYGYVAIFFSNAVSTATIPIPFLSILAQALIAWYGAEGSPVLAGLIGGTAMSVGQIPNFAVGAVSMPAVERRLEARPRLRRRALAIVADVERRGWIAVFALSFIPNPFTTFSDMAAGYSGMSFRTFYLAVWTARVIRALIIAFLGQAFLDAVLE